ncbi:hypothetical protein [Deinococcus apachensis]|uniref:hypothetical protein n=1 Tax=Deinococcus apachensis TaxID=309886 RepID=UPI00037A766D|nr:hypothetical protein [Deinococcus apachensis]
MLLKRIRARHVMTLTLLALLTGAAATRVLPGSPLGPVPSQPVRTGAVPEPTSWEPPTFELLVTVRALAELAQRDVRVFTAASSAQLTRVLEPLERQRRLTPAQAEATLDAIARALGSSGQRQLQEARVRLDTQVHMQLASSRYARGDDVLDMATFRLALLVPGGQATVAAVNRDPEFNPFLRGAPAATLKKLMLSLRR